LKVEDELQIWEVKALSELVFATYLKKLKNAWAEEIADPDLINLLYDAVSEPMELVNKENGTITTEKSAASKIMNRQKGGNALKVIRTNANKDKVRSSIEQYFEKNVVKRLHSDCIDDLISNLKKIIEGDSSISETKKEKLLKNASRNKLAAFLGFTYLYSLTRDNVLKEIRIKTTQEIEDYKRHPLREIPTPPEVIEEERKYADALMAVYGQAEGINYILEHPIAAVILGMGLGKTSITLTAIEQLIYDSFEVSKVLVVAPLRVARNTWSDEIHKWNHLKHLRYSIVLGSAAERKKALEADADIYIINRENLQWLIEQSGVNFFWDMVVLDELSSFKNWNCKRFKAFMKVRPNVKRVIGLTGTPSSNGLMDLFAEFKCLDMGERLGRFISQYRVNYFVPDRMNGPIVYSYKLRNGAEEQIYEKISDITISMKALDHLQMPELISNEYPVYMNDEEAKLYADMEEDLFIPLKKGEITAANAAALSGKLLQMANGAVYSDDGDEIVIHDQKLDALEDMIEAANGRSVMVAYWFKHDLSRIMRRLTEKKIPFEKLDSEESIRKWNRGELPVALIHPASAGHGLNLQSGGNTLIWFGLTWSLELYQQTVARLWRQGQTAETVVVQHIITAGTIDEDIMKALASKDMTQNRLIAAVKARVTHGR